MKKILFIAFMLVASIPAWAASFACPSATPRYVSPGATMGQVIITCGPPTKTITETAPGAAKSPIVQWVYSRRSPVPSKMSIEIKNDKIVALNIDGNNVTSTTFCGPAVHMGSTPTQVQSLCGRPQMINQLKQQTKHKKIVKLIYQPQSYLPAVTFIFENNKLIAKQ